jgi:hypothetical protein
VDILVNFWRGRNKRKSENGKQKAEKRSCDTGSFEMKISRCKKGKMKEKSIDQICQQLLGMVCRFVRTVDIPNLRHTTLVSIINDPLKTQGGSK